ncbi:MAG: cytochrome c3 family protein [Nitrospirota bacterium]
MKRVIQILVFTITFAFTCLSYAGIVNTKHNMSVTGPGGIKATGETEICVFCHIPHNAQPGRPLWNHDMPGSAYTMYTSEYLHRAGYTLPTGLGTTTGTPGMLSRQCLSCHDGTVAVGAVYMVRGTILGTNLIAMSGVTADKMPTAAAGYIGTDLTKHHPVGIEYNSAITIAFGSGSRTIELITNPTSTAMKLYSISAKNYVECSSCHDPHLENVRFLRDTSGATFAAKISNTCTACHTKTGWSGSIHQTSAAAYADPDVNTTFGAGTITSLVCMNCHRTHKGLGTPYLLRQAEETTCFQGAGDNTPVETGCHGSSATATTNRIQTVITRTYKHPTTTISGKHTDLDVLYPTDAGKGLQWSDSKHAECVDCHNPHKAKNTPARVGTSAWYPTTVDNTSNQTVKSGALIGVTGVEPGSATKWTVPTTFTTQESSTYEYQICYKCHSYWALRDADGITTYTTASGATVTDQAMEFNPNNYSAHPVEVTLNNQTGSYAPKPLVSSQMTSPWTAVGNQTMYCSDCHGTDNETSGDPKGPHGANVKYMLKGTNKYWPTKSDYSTLWKLSDISGGTASGLFCLNCHPMYSGGTWYNNVHSKHVNRQGICVMCHIAVPHGGKRSRLIGYTSDIPPYDYTGAGTYDKLVMTGFKKASTPTGYAKANCYSTVTGCTTHSNQGGYDP